MTENVALWIASGLQTLALGWAASKLTKIDKLQDQLEKKADEIIKAKMEVLESRLMRPIERLDTLMTQVQQRLADGNDHFGDVDNKVHQLELKLTEKINDARREMLARMPGRN